MIQEGGGVVSGVATPQCSYTMQYNNNYVRIYIPGPPQFAASFGEKPKEIT